VAQPFRAARGGDAGLKACATHSDPVDPIAIWNELLDGEAAGELCQRLADRMRARRLHFGGRLLCPFLRPFFLDASDEERVRHAAETLWTLGERIARLAPGNQALDRKSTRLNSSHDQISY